MAEAVEAANKVEVDKVLNKTRDVVAEAVEAVRRRQ